MQLIKSTELTEAQKQQMFCLFTKTMQKHFNMSINDICYSFLTQFERSNFYVVLTKKGYIAGYEQDKDTFHITDLYFENFSKELKFALEKMKQITDKYAAITCNCNLNSASLAKTFGFGFSYCKMIKYNRK